ncbi:MAG: hypothetical protein LBF97_03015 [Elusimicrobiota bacterium]|jgi:hypothetical protein|nr:hypothetical protein [Elusimicrobiota bacterium]
MFLTFISIVLGIIFVILLYATPIILIFGIYNMKHELHKDKLITKFFGLKNDVIYFAEIENIEKFSNMPFLKGKYENIILNKAIKIKLNKTDKRLIKAKIIIPKNRDIFIEEFKGKINDYKSGQR